MNNFVKNLLLGVGRYFLGAIITFALICFCFTSLGRSSSLTPQQDDALFLLLTFALPLLYVWRFWKGGLASVVILFILNLVLGGGDLSSTSNKLSSDCINEYTAKHIIEDYYEERFFTQGVTWFSNEWISIKNSNGTVKVTTNYYSKFCQPICKEIFEVDCDGTYRLIGID